MSSVRRFGAMGSEVVVGGADDAQMRAIEALFAHRERTFSRFLPGSELCAVNASEATSVVVSELFAETFSEAAFLLGTEGPGWLDEHGLPGRFESRAGVAVNRTWQAALRTPEPEMSA